MSKFKRILLSAMAAAFVLVASWVSGYDFNERGYVALIVFAWSSFTAYAVYVLTKNKAP